MALIVVASAWVGCIGQESALPEDPAPPGPMRAASSSFEPGHRIPAEYTCDGAEVSPPLTVDGLPNGTRTVALIVADPDVPTPRTGATNFTHWLVWNARPVASSVFFPTNGTPPGSIEGENGGGETGYLGPCPPPGSPPHRYVFTFFAVDAVLELDEGANRSQLEDALEGHVLDEAGLVGTYQRDVVPLPAAVTPATQRLPASGRLV